MRVSSKSRYTVLNLGFFFASLIQRAVLGALMLLPSFSAQTVCKKCCRVSATRYPLSLISKDLATLPKQQSEPSCARGIGLSYGFQTYLLLREGSFNQFLILLLLFLSTSLPILFFPINLSRVKLLVDLTFSGKLREFSRARQAPILLSTEVLTSRSQVLLLKEYLYFGALIESNWQLFLRINYIYQTYKSISPNYTPLKLQNP